MPEIELLYFDGCPSWQIALENVGLAIEAEKLPHRVRLVGSRSPAGTGRAFSGLSLVSTGWH